MRPIITCEANVSRGGADARERGSAPLARVIGEVLYRNEKGRLAPALSRGMSGGYFDWFFGTETVVDAEE